MAGTPPKTLAAACAAIAIALFAPAAAGAATMNVTAGMGEGGEDDLCSLREAVTAASQNSIVNGGGAGPDCPQGNPFLDTINLPAGTYTIGGAASNEDLNASGDYDIQTANGPVSIAGAGSGSTTIDANDLDRAIHTIGSTTFALSGVTLTDGTTSSIIGGGGGGVFVNNSGATSLTDVVVSNNVAAGAQGGGISVSSAGTQTYTRVTVTGNDSNGTGLQPSGGGIFFSGGSSVLTDSTVTGNEVDHLNDTDGISMGGGGIDYDSAASGTISRTTISGNSVDTLAAQFPGGGGIFHEAAAGNLSIVDSTISGNTVTGGSQRTGGAIEWLSSTPSLDQLAIDNTTISGNSVTTAALSVGGGIRAVSGTVDIANATFTGNTAESASGDGIAISTNNVANGSTFEFRGTILDEGGANECFESGINANLTSSGYNIERGATNDCGFAATGDQLLNTSAINAGLAANGGPTQTHSIPSGSAARDTIPPASCLNSSGAAQAADQRGVPRPTGTNCDAGAYEYAECVGVAVNVVGTGGADVINGTAAADGILAGDGADTIDAGAGADKVCAGDGADTLTENADAAGDQFLGEAGTDALSFAGLPAAAYSAVVGSTGTASGGGVGTDLINSVENAIGSAGNDSLTGDGGANSLEGMAGDDTLEGGGGDDTVVGGESGEVAGDTMSFFGALVPVSFDLAGSSPQGTGQGNDTFSEMENVLGGNAADTLAGDSANNTLNGGFGTPADSLEGRGGNDTLDATGSGTDGGGDTVVYDEAENPVTVDLSNAGPQVTGDGTDTIADAENVTGSVHDDELTASPASNILDGGLGEDTASFAGGPAVDANLTTDGATGAGIDQLPAIESLVGSSSGDTLTGDAGANVLSGGDGADTLTGEGGPDSILAGTGADGIFIRDSVADSADCGADADLDTVEADLAGVDALASCGTDTVDFGAVTPPPTTTPPPATTKKKCKKGFKLKKIKRKGKPAKKKCVRVKKKRKR